MPERDTSPSSTPVEERIRSPANVVSPIYRLLLSLLVAGGLVGLIFGGYEIVERLWLGHLEDESLRTLHRVRGILTAMVVGVIVGWVVIRSSPALLTATAVEEDVPPERVREERLRLYAHWFIAMRWIATLVAGLLIFLGVRVFHLLPQETWWPLMGTVGVLAASNVFYTLHIRRSSRIRPLLVLQCYLDLAILTVLLHYSGGVENPLAVFMLFHVIIGGILLSRAECFRLAAAGSLLFFLVGLGEGFGIIPHYSLHLIPHPGGDETGLQMSFTLSAVTVHAAVLFLGAYFVTTLAERLRRNERRLTSLAERALADRRLLEQALESTSTGMRVLTPGLVPEWTNDRWKAWFGAGGTTCRIFPEFPGIGCPAEECMRKNQMEVAELERPPNGRGRQVFQITSAPIHDVRGELNRIVQLAHDITARKSTHERMMRAGQLAAVGELAGQVAHEVNNPIAIISAKANLLLKNRRGEMSDKIAQELAKTVELSDRVARIAQGLLSYSRPSPTTRGPIDLRLSIRKSLAIIEDRARNREIVIEEKFSDEPLTVIANASEMEQVFLNLFINAIQAMPDGGRLTISVLAPETLPATDNGGNASMLSIAVDDTGGGISPEFRERVFEPFYTTKPEGSGTGLGLSICQGLLRSQGGEIVIMDSPGGGARFVVKLPNNDQQPIDKHRTGHGIERRTAGNEQRA